PEPARRSRRGVRGPARRGGHRGRHHAGPDARPHPPVPARARRAGAAARGVTAAAAGGAILRRVRWPAALLLVAIAALPGAHAQPARWRGHGVVVALLPAPSSLHATRPVVVLDHEPIAGLMEERVSMPFIAASAD